jgi:hypothetical protein
MPPDGEYISVARRRRPGDLHARSVGEFGGKQRLRAADAL